MTEVCPICVRDDSISRQDVRVAIAEFTCQNAFSHPDRQPYIWYSRGADRPRAHELRQLVMVQLNKQRRVGREMLFKAALEGDRWALRDDGDTYQASCGCSVSLDDRAIWISTCDRHLYGMLTAERRLWDLVVGA